MSTNNLNANKFDIEKIIEKMEDVDHDFRFMAASDLADEMQKENFKLNPNIERRVVDGVIKLLGDKSGDVKGMIVKCLGPLVQKVNEENVSRIIVALLDHICEHETKKSKMREISTLGLKAIIKSVDEKHGASVSEQLINELIKGVKIQDAPQVTSECLDILNDLLKRFGGSLSEKNFKLIVEALIPELKGKHQLAKKRTIHCLASISPFINEELFVKIAEELLQGLNVESNKRTYIQAVGILARSVGKRIGVYVDKFSPLLLEAIKSEEDDEDDIKDYALQTFESFLVSCRENVSEKLFQTILEIVSDKIKYDPNYNEEEDEKDNSGSDNEDDYDDENDESSQEIDDESWKVRKASAKVFGAAMDSSSNKEKLDLANKIVPILSKRLSERAETVRLEIYSTFVELLKHVQSVLKNNEEKVKKLLSELVPSIVKQLTKQLTSKYPKTKIAALQLLKEFLNTSPSILQEHVSEIVKAVIPSIGENKNLPLKIEAISFVKLLCTHNKPKFLVAHLEQLSNPIFSSVKSPNVQAATEALKVCVEFLKILDSEKPNFDVKKFVTTLRSSVSPQFRANDIDFHIKESAINVVSLLISKFQVHLTEENLKEDLKLLVSRLKNEITRPAALNSFELIGSSKIPENYLGFVLNEVVEELISCIRKASRHLKTGALSTLYTLIKNYGQLKEISTLYALVIEELAGQLESSSNDLFIYQLSFRLITQILISSPSCVSVVKEKLYKQVLILVKNSIFEGKALDALLSFFGQLVIISGEGFGFDVLLESLLQNNESKKNKNFSLIAKCVSSVCVNSGKEKCISTVEKFLKNIKEVVKEQQKIAQQQEEKSNSENKEISTEEQISINPEILISIYAIGEIGKQVDLSEQSTLQETLFNCFDTQVEELRSAASLSLGRSCTGNLDKFIPFILGNIKDNNPKRQYLLLHSLKQVVVGKSSNEGINELNKHFDHIIEILFEQASNEDEHSIVAECLGKLATLDPKKMIPKLAEAVNNEKKRVCILASLRYLKFSHQEESDKENQEIHNKNSDLFDQLAPNLDLFFSFLNDKSAVVRGSILQSLNYLTASIPQLVSKYLSKYMNVFYEQTKIKEELIRFVDLGPFKHEVDDGLDLRKYAYQCMYTLLENCLELVSVESYIQHIITGLSDQNEIKLQCHLLIVKLANISGNSLLKSLNSIVDPLRTEIARKIDSSSVSQAKNGALELKRSALSAVAAITKKIPDWQTSTKFAELVNGINLTPVLKEMYVEIIKEFEN